MSTSEPGSVIRSAAAVRAEAAAWLARLQGPNRTAGMEAGLRRWLAEDAEHRTAFELVTDAWEKSARLQRRPQEKVLRWQTRGFRLSVPRAALASIAVALVACVATVAYLSRDEMVTAVGELRTLRLDDGTRVFLNTDTVVRQHYDKQVRRVELERGEAMFEVAKNPDWPFIVTAGDRQVRALGTSFVVRHDDKGLIVTLVEGKVSVSPTNAARRIPTTEGAGNAHVAGKQETVLVEPQDVVTLVPGERLTFGDSRDGEIDRPRIDTVTAWQRGQVAFDGTPLAEAVAEMNRYSNVRIVVDDPSAASIPISGSFRAGDSLEFAHAVAKAYRLHTVGRDDEIVLRAM